MATIEERAAEPLRGHMTTIDVITVMSEGNPGAVTVMAELIKGPGSLMDLLHLDDMNMRGSQIWVGYKDYAGQNMDLFLKAIRSRDQIMVDTVNKECSYTGHKAVCYEGSRRG